MYILSALFDADLATTCVTDLLATGDAPDLLAEKMGWPNSIDLIREALRPTSFKRLIQEVTRINTYLDYDKQIADLKADRHSFRFLGPGYRDRQILKLEESKLALGSLLDAPRWFYTHPRVVLLSGIRDCGLDASIQSDPQWVMSKGRSLCYPMVEMFENGNVSAAKSLAQELEKPFKSISPRFVLEKFEGHRSITFDFNTKVTLFYTATSGG